MSFTLCTLNANGIRAAAKKGFSDWLERKKPDLLCLQELRAHVDQVPPGLVSPAGYNTFWQPAVKKGYAGAALLARPRVDAFTPGSGLDWSDDEGRVVRADLGPLTVVSMYLPSGSSGEERQERKFEFMNHVLGYTKKLLAKRPFVAVCGDLNIAHTELDIHNPKGNAKNSGFLPEERTWFSKWLRQGWVDVFRSLHEDEPGLYSWWSNRGQARAKDRGWRIDYVLASPALAERATRAWIDREAGLSDHAPVWVEFEGEARPGEAVLLD